MATLRKDLIELLIDNPMPVKDIARHMKINPKRVVDDLEHLFQSLKHTEYVEEVVPAECRKCDFKFSEEKLSKPSRCPECKGTWLLEPQIAIRRK